MSERADRRLELGLTQAEAARRAGRSLDTWRKWEADPESVGERSRRRCAAVLRMDAGEVTVDSAIGAHYARTWGENPAITPRQAYAISLQLSVWADMYIAEWLLSPDDPLHGISPFDDLDLRVMMMVGDNRAWAEGVRRRCREIAGEIEDGVLPCDRPGPYIDEVLVGAAMSSAATWMADDPDIVDGVPARESVVPADDEEGYIVGDYDWGELEDEYDDRCLWGDWDIPLLPGSPMLRTLLQQRHPYTWLDPQVDVAPDAEGGLDRLLGAK